MIKFPDASTMYVTMLKQIMNYGQATSPRGQGTREVLGARIVLEDASRNIIAHPERGLNYYFSISEWLYILLGHNDVETIARFNSRIAQFSDDGVTFRGAYGPKLTEQLPYALEKLKSDRDSRQAVVTLWRESPSTSRDIPCTVAFQWLLRDDKLHGVTFMRSNDLWLGTPYDIYNFTQIQAYVAAALDVPVGSYTHFTGSLHLYDSNIEAAQRVVDASSQTFTPPASPPLTYPVPQVIRSRFGYLADTTLWEPLEQADKLLEDVPRPWRDYLAVLAHRTLKHTTLPEPWRTLIRKHGLKVWRDR